MKRLLLAISLIALLAGCGETPRPAGYPEWSEVPGGGFHTICHDGNRLYVGRISAFHVVEGGCKDGYSIDHEPGSILGGVR